MSDVIRNAVVKLGIQLSNPSLKIPSLKVAIDQQREWAGEIRRTKEATEEAQKSVAKQDAATKKLFGSLGDATKAQSEMLTANRAVADAALEATRATEQAAAARQQEINRAERLSVVQLKVAKAYTQAAEGAMQMARGAALLAGADSESIQKAMKYVFVVQGAIDLTKGYHKLKKAMTEAYKLEATAATLGAVATGGFSAAIRVLKVELGPIGWALIAIGLAYATYQKYANAAAEAERRLSEQRERSINSTKIAASYQLQLANATGSVVEKEKMLQAIASGDTFGSALDERLSASRQLMDIAKQSADRAKESINDQIEMVKLKEREVDAAKAVLKAEQDRSLSLRASIGALDTGERARLNQLVSKVESGGSLSREESIDLQRLGSQLGGKIADNFLEKMDDGLGGRLERAYSKITGDDPRAKAQQDFERTQRERDKATGGVSSADKIRSLEATGDELVVASEEVFERLLDQQRNILRKIEALEHEKNRQKGAAVANGHSGGASGRW